MRIVSHENHCSDSIRAKLPHFLTVFPVPACLPNLLLSFLKANVASGQDFARRSGATLYYQRTPTNSFFDKIRIVLWGIIAQWWSLVAVKYRKSNIIENQKQVFLTVNLHMHLQKCPNQFSPKLFLLVPFNTSH